MGSSRNPRTPTRVLERSTWLAAPVEAVFAFHENPRNLEKISPPALRVVRIQADPSARVGGVFRIVARPFGVGIDWTGQWLAVEAPTRLVDGAVRARIGGATAGVSLAIFDHEHRFAPEGSGTRMTDRVTYAVLGGDGGLAARAANLVVAALVLAPMFRARHRATRRFFS